MGLSKSRKEVHLWNTQTGNSDGTTIACQQVVDSAALSPDGKCVMITTDDSIISQSAQLWDAESGRPIGDAIKHTNPSSSFRSGTVQSQWEDFD